MTSMKVVGLGFKHNEKAFTYALSWLLETSQLSMV
jgi:hypothetical protein